ncbi:MAG: energy transducer TonB [Myxococcota bacterium]|nr:energy transducer TonB [Myxococcota bacterium]
MPSPKAFRIPEPRGENARSFVFGAAFAFALFVLMAVAQLIGDVDAPDERLAEEAIAFKAPEIEQVEEEEPPPPEEPPEIEEEPPQLSLDQLDLALNPGAGNLAGDFSLAAFNPTAGLASEDFVDFSSLDQVPRPVGATQLNIPNRLRKQPVNGRIVLLLQISKDGAVLDAQIESSSLPRFNDLVVSQVRGWRFTPPTQQGKPVRAQARFPIPIRIN